MSTQLLKLLNIETKIKKVTLSEAFKFLHKKQKLHKCDGYKFIVLPSFSNPKYLVRSENFAKFRDSFNLLIKSKSKKNFYNLMKPFIYYLNKDNSIVLAKNNFKNFQFNIGDTSIKAIIIGSKGENNTPTIITEKFGEINFLKYACNKTSKKSLQNEYNFHHRFSRLNYPLAEINDKCFKGNFHFISSKEIQNISSICINPNSQIIDFLFSLKNNTDKSVKFSNSHQYKFIEHHIKKHACQNELIKSEWELIINKLSNSNIPCVFGHGDFAPFNIFSLKDNKLSVIDFERSHENAGFCSDISHFFMQREFSLNKEDLFSDYVKRWIRIYIEKFDPEFYEFDINLLIKSELIYFYLYCCEHKTDLNNNFYNYVMKKLA